jgi:hypothetical protein
MLCCIYVLTSVRKSCAQSMLLADVCLLVSCLLARYSFLALLLRRTNKIRTTIQILNFQQNLIFTVMPVKRLLGSNSAATTYFKVNSACAWSKSPSESESLPYPPGE